MTGGGGNIARGGKMMVSCQELRLMLQLLWFFEAPEANKAYFASLMYFYKSQYLTHKFIGNKLTL